MSTLTSLLCRHDYYWSERHRSDRCRRCGRVKAAEVIEDSAPAPQAALPPRALEPELAIEAEAAPALKSRARLTAKGAKAQAVSRRVSLLEGLERLADGGDLTRADMINTVLAIIEDAHSADPVLFGSDAAQHFARLHEARDDMAGTSSDVFGQRPVYGAAAGTAN